MEMKSIIGLFNKNIQTFIKNPLNYSFNNSMYIKKM